MRTWQRWAVSGSLVTLGLATLVTGFAYDITFAGIPYPDPSPELQARFRRHSEVASGIETAGAVLLLAGIVAVTFVAVWSIAFNRSSSA